MLREGADIRVEALFYSAAIHAVLIFGSDSWEMSDATMKAVEGENLGFLCQTTGKRTRRQAYGECETPAVEEVLQAAGTQSAAKYIGHRN